MMVEMHAVLESIEQRLKVVSDKELDTNVGGWLAAPDVSQNFNAAIRKRQAGTGDWFLDGPQFAEWKETSNVLLCIYGAPGCGKTVLCSTVIEAVKDLCKSRLLSGWAYFFFDSRNANKGLQLYENFLRSVLVQLSSRCGGIPEAVKTMYQVHGNGREQPAVKALEEALRQVMEAFDDVYIMVDSLDESGDRTKLLDWIETVARWSSARWHVLATSRSEPDITSHLERIPNIRIVRLQGTALDKDIIIFLDERLSLIIRWSEPIRTLIKTTLVEGADGMFRWVAMHMDSLEHCFNVRAVKEKLKTLPKDLEETYEQILASSPHQKDLLHMLHWLAFSARALQLEEIAEVPSVDFYAADGPCYDPELKYSHPSLALTVCSGLVTVTDGVVKLAHFSVKEYLLSDRIKTGTAAHFAINQHISQSFIAQTCAAYLLIFNRSDSIRSSRGIQRYWGRDPYVATTGDFPLHLYAAEHLSEHLRLMEDNDCSALQVLLLKLFIPTPRYKYALVNWVVMHNFDKDGGLDEVAPPLYYASFLGLRDVAERLLENGADVHFQGGMHDTALMAAAADGHTETIKLLLERGANANFLAKRWPCTPLLVAVERGDTDIAHILLDHGADIELEGVGMEEAATNPLQHAVENGRTDMVQLLLERGADVNGTTEYNWTALHLAAHRGCTGIVILLLEHGADVNMKMQYSEEVPAATALQAAACEGHTDIAKMLLEHGADANINGGEDCMTALQAAACGGHTDIAKMLLEHGADVSINGGGYGTALQEAACEDHTDITKMLLEHGADDDINGGGHWALMVAVCRGHTETVKMLLEHDADVNSRAGIRGTALQAAAPRGRTEIVKLLLEHGADVHIRGGMYYGTVLEVAEHRGHTETVKILLEHGAGHRAGGTGPPGYNPHATRG